MQTKPAIRSLGVLGGVSSFFSIIAFLTELQRFIAEHPELIDDSKMAITALIAAVSSLVAILGRWRAIKPIKGIFSSGKPAE